METNAIRLALFFLSAAAGVLLATETEPRVQEDAAAPLVPSRPIAGAIRWDAWSGGPVTAEVQRSLGPAKYHDRLPWFAEVEGDARVRIDGGSAAIMDQEIEYAAGAGLDYWAFLLYPESDTMSNALHCYLRSPKRSRINFCLILHNAFGVAKEQWPRERDRAIALLQEPGYQTVLGGRPLVFEFHARFNGRFPQERFDEFREAAKQTGLNPYCVFMGWNPPDDFFRVSAYGFDAVSSYACTTQTLTTFRELAEQAEAKYWQRAADAGVPYLPLVTTGWNKQPRKDHPVSWERDHAYHKQTVFTAAATPDDIASHLRRSLSFVQRHRTICAANAVIIYAWNEHDEGGWLVPTWTSSGQPNTSRLDAIRSVLREAK